MSQANVLLASVKNVAGQLAASAMKYYDGNKPGGTPGMIMSIGEFNWWEAGALFGQVSASHYLRVDERD
jgi:hypothetical protein